MADSVSTGTILAGRYRIDARLGAGGMGVVWRARDLKLERDVALKLLPSESIGDGAARARLVREARAAARLEHPAIVHVYDVGETDDGGAYLVMELVRGESLTARLRDPAYSIVSRIRLIADVARALAFAHRDGFVHRDVKPDNVMVRADGRPVVLDFGVAKVVDVERSGDAITLTAKGAIVGTPAYLSPEQARAGEIDGRSDQWALGIVTYEALTGRRPWTESSIGEVFAAILTEEPPSLRELAPAIPEGLEKIVLRALAKRADDRFPDCDAFADALLAVDLDRIASTPNAAPSPDTVDPNSHDALASTISGAEVLAASDSGAAPRTSTPTASGVSPPPVVTDRVSRPTRANPRRPVTALAIGALSLAMIGSGAWWMRSRSHAARATTTAPASPLFGSHPRIACPILEANGVEAPSGWLGAAAAATLCNEVRTTTQWFADDAVLSPAHLLGIPRRPDESIADDPYAASELRARTIAAARERADAYFDGSVTRSDGGFDLDVSLRGRDGTVLAHATGHGEVIYLAAEEAVRRIEAAHVFPPTPAFGEAERNATGCDTARGNRVLVRLMNEYAQMSSRLDEVCAEAERIADELGSQRAPVRRGCAHFRLRPDAPAEPIDPSTPWSFARTAGSSILLVDATAVPDIAARTHRLLNDASDPALRVVLFRLQSLAEFRLGHGDAAREAIMRAAELEPSNLVNWNILFTQFEGRPDFEAAAHATRAWAPHAALSWDVEVAMPTPATVAQLRRSFILAPAHDDAARALANALIETGHIVDASVIGHRLAAEGPRHRFPAATIIATADFAHAHFGAGLARVHETFESDAATPGTVDQELALALVAMPAAIVTGHGTEWADHIATHHVDPEPVRIPRASQTFAAQIAIVCLHATPAVAARCIPRLRTLVTANFFDGNFEGTTELLRGADAYLRGDMREAARAWRVLVATAPDLSRLVPTVLADAFDRAGEHDLADSVYALAAERPPTMNGAEWWYPAAAQRAAARGDLARARELSAAVVRAWALADVSVPSVAAMRALAR